MKRKDRTPRAIWMAARGSQRPFPAGMHFLLCPVEAYPSLTSGMGR